MQSLIGHLIIFLVALCAFNLNVLTAGESIPLKGKFKKPEVVL